MHGDNYGGCLKSCMTLSTNVYLGKCGAVDYEGRALVSTVELLANLMSCLGA